MITDLDREALRRELRQVDDETAREVMKWRLLTEDALKYPRWTAGEWDDVFGETKATFPAQGPNRWAPTENPVHTWMVIEAMRGRGYVWRLTDLGLAWDVRILRPHLSVSITRVEHEELGVATCLAALEAVRSDD